MTAGISLVQGKTGAHRASLQLFLGWATGVLKESGTVSPAPGSRAAVSSSVFSFVSGGVTVTESGIATTATEVYCAFRQACPFQRSDCEDGTTNAAIF